MKIKGISKIWFAPIITLAIFSAIYAFAGIFPFGASSTAYSDGIAQFLPFLSELAQKIKDGGSMLFTWHSGMGMNFWATIAYYLASPFNLIALCFTPDKTDIAFSIITLIKPVLASLTFALFLKYSYNKTDFSAVAFSVLWAFSGFIIGGLFIISWYDSVIYFPIVILGLKRLTEGKSAILYSVFLGLSIVSNFYIGWIICIFCVIYFIYSFISDDEIVYEKSGDISAETENNGEEQDSINLFSAFSQSYLLKTFFKFIASSLLAGGISAVFTIPVASALSNTSKTDVHNIFTVPKSVIGILASHIYSLGNNYYTMSSTNYIYAFAGVITVISAVAYFFAKGISVRKKAGNLFLLIVMWASVAFYALYSVWHGFAVPAGFMYRFAFVYSFVLLKIAYESLINIKNIPVFGILAGTAVAVICASAGLFDDNKAVFAPVYKVIAVFAFIIIYTVILILLSKKAKLSSVLNGILTVCIICETVIMNLGGIKATNLRENLGEYGVVNSFTQNSDSVARIQFQSQKQTFGDSVMYGQLFGFNSLDGYSSMCDGNFTLTSSYLGTHGNGMNQQMGSQEQTPVYNMIFPIQYYIDGSGNLNESFFRNKVSEKDGYTMYQMNYSMPFMYTVSPSVVNWSPVSFPLVADCQNESVKALCGTDKNILIYNTNGNLSYDNCTEKPYYNMVAEDYEEKGIEISETYKTLFDYMQSHMANVGYEIEDTAKPAYISFDSVAQTDGIMYIYVDVSEFAELKVEINSEERNYYAYGVGEERIYELGEVQKGDAAKITVGGYKEQSDGTVYHDKESFFTATCFTVEKESLDEAYAKLDAMSDTQILEFKDTYVKAEVDSFEDGMLYIPTAYDEGWTVSIDGEEVTLYEHGSHILMTEIAKGEHIVEMKYMPVGFIPGVSITLGSLVILIAWAVIVKKRLK